MLTLTNHYFWRTIMSIGPPPDLILGLAWLNIHPQVVQLVADLRVRGLPEVM